MNVGDIYGPDVLIGLGVIGLIGGMLGGKGLGGRLFHVVAAWLVLIAAWPVVLAVMLAVAAFFVGLVEVFTGIDAWGAGHALLAKGFSFGLVVMIYGKLVWEEMRSPHLPHGAYVPGPPKSVMRKVRWQ